MVIIPLSSRSLCVSLLLSASPALSVSPVVFLAPAAVSSPAPDARAPEAQTYKNEPAGQTNRYLLSVTLMRFDIHRVSTVELNKLQTQEIAASPMFILQPYEEAVNREKIRC